MPRFSPPEEPRSSYLQGLPVLQLEAQHLSKASSLAGSQTLSGCALAGTKVVATTANRATKQILEFIWTPPCHITIDDRNPRLCLTGL
ncbi:hypothetical protein PI125_g11986 [Phytophthora idaei]|nr:hypothetical protein PI125_g11986 [Phytophthora idaei]